MRRISALAFVLIFAGCIPGRLSTEEKETALKAVSQFHERLNSSKDDDIYASTHEMYRKEISQETNRGFLARVRRKFGRFGATDCPMPMGSPLPGVGSMAILICKTETSKGAIDEQFQWETSGDRPLLVKYEIKHPSMLVD